MSYILDALKRAEQRDQRQKTPNSRAAEPAVESSAWHVKMVSPARYARFRRKEEGDAAEPKVRGLPKGAGIAAALLTLLLLIECVLVYDNRARMSVVATEVSKLTRQISETEGRTAKTERDRLNFKLENETLRQELEAASADLNRARSALEALKARQKRQAARKRQPTVTEQQKFRGLPLASASPPLASGAPFRAEGPSRFDTVEAATVKVYSIR